MSEADEPFLFRLYSSTRTKELVQVPWSPQKAAFVIMQEQVQHMDSKRDYPHADLLIIQGRGADIGRLYLERREREHHIINIALCRTGATTDLPARY